MLGFGPSELVRVGVDDHGRMRLDATAEALRSIDGPLNDVVLNQVLVRFEADGAEADALTRDVIVRVQAEGTCWAGGSVWQGHQVMRISVSNWSTT
jgi:hypothetical protein